jgi:hypothetical protein
LISIIVESTLIIVEETTSKKTPQSTQGVDLENFQRIIDVPEVKVKATSNVENSGDRANQDSSPVLNSICDTSN